MIRGTTFPAGKILEPGVVQWDVKGDTTLGPFEPKPAAAERSSGSRTPAPVPGCRRSRCRCAARAMAQGDLQRGQQPDRRAHGPHARARLRGPALRALVSGLVDEGKAVAAAQGIVLDADPEELIDHAAKPEVAYGHKASMLQDVEARRRTEVDYLNGGIARFGRELGVPTPLNDAVTALIKGVERSWS